MDVKINDEEVLFANKMVNHYMESMVLYTKEYEQALSTLSGQTFSAPFVNQHLQTIQDFLGRLSQELSVLGKQMETLARDLVEEVDQADQFLY